jgi:broad specificity phosphatase PhoE
MSNTELGLLRHGQTDWNINLRLQGTADIPMNEVGVAQIQLAAEKLAEQPWDLILSSPLGRAMHSAQIVAARLGIYEVMVEPLL